MSLLESTPEENTALFESISSYPWSSDPEFQLGLQSILAQSKSSQQSKALTLRAQTFYYARKHNVEVDFQEYMAWHNRRKREQPINPQPQTQSTPQESEVQETTTPQIQTQQPEQPRHPVNFSHVVNLITRGEPVPGIREIPSTLLSGQETQATCARRKKPWEKDEPTSVTA